MPRLRSAVALTAIIIAGTLGFQYLSARMSPVVTLPAPAIDQPRPTTASIDTAVLAGGCFWGVQAVFQHVDGVTSAVSGYTGGDLNAPTYNIVSTGMSGHAESVRVTYDPSRVSYGTLLRVFFAVAHDPTQLDYQGPDHGTQYRSAIFTGNDEQARIAKAYVAQLTTARTFSSPIVTEVTPLKTFHPAEDYHQDYATKHPYVPYIVINDAPKVARLKKTMPALYRN